jgi:hypothetical protein
MGDQYKNNADITLYYHNIQLRMSQVDFRKRSKYPTFNKTRTKYGKAKKYLNVTRKGFISYSLMFSYTSL